VGTLTKIQLFFQQKNSSAAIKVLSSLGKLIIVCNCRMASSIRNHQYTQQVAI